MSFVKDLLFDLQRDLSGEDPRYGEPEDFYSDGPWPTELETEEDERLN